MSALEEAIRNVSDFPKPGIEFKDISLLLSDSVVFRETIDRFRDYHLNDKIDMVVGIEARGFVFGPALAYALGAGFCMARKPGKLPYEVYRQEYDLEYGTDALELHIDAFSSGQRVLLMDDLLATGGSIGALVSLIRRHFDVEIVGVDFLIELSFLKGRERLKGLPVCSLVEY